MRTNVKIQKKLISLKKDPKRYVHQVTIPEKVLKDLGWTEGAELKPYIVDNVLIFKKIK